MSKLTKKQSVFVQEYLVDLNATQAAIRAGYSAKTANEQAAQLLAKLSIQEALRKAMEAREKRTGITIDRVLEQYAKLAFFDIRKLYDESGNFKPVKDWDDETAAAVAGVETTELLGKEGGVMALVRKVKLADRRAALADIGKHLGMFTEKIEHSGSINTEVEIYRIPDNGRD